MPKGFSITNPDTPDGKTTKKSDGVFEYAPKPNMTGTVELLFNKLEDGVSKEFHGNIEVLNAVTPSDYLVDDYVTVPVGISRVIQTLANDKPYRYAVRNVEYDISGGGDFNLAQQGDPREGRVMFSAFGRFNGSVSFSYIVTYVNGDKDTAVVHVVVSNFEPAQDEFQITAVKGLTQVLKYSVPEDFKQQGFYDFQFKDRKSVV